MLGLTCRNEVGLFLLPYNHDLFESLIVKKRIKHGSLIANVSSPIINHAATAISIRDETSAIQLPSSPGEQESVDQQIGLLAPGEHAASTCRLFSDQKPEGDACVARRTGPPHGVKGAVWYTEPDFTPPVGAPPVAMHVLTLNHLTPISYSSDLSSTTRISGALPKSRIFDGAIYYSEETVQRRTASAPKKVQQIGLNASRKRLGPDEDVVVAGKGTSGREGAVKVGSEQLLVYSTDRVEWTTAKRDVHGTYYRRSKLEKNMKWDEINKGWGHQTGHSPSLRKSFTFATVMMKLFCPFVTRTKHANDYLYSAQYEIHNVSTMFSRPTIMLLFMMSTKLIGEHFTEAHVSLLSFVPFGSVNLEKGFLLIQPNVPVQLYAFGINMDAVETLALSARNKPDGYECDNDRITTPFKTWSANTSHLLFKITLTRVIASGTLLFLCTQEKEGNKSHRWRHRETIYPEGIKLIYSDFELPLYAMIIIMIIALIFSACFSGLHIGLLKLDKVMLQVVKSAGSPDEQSYAAVIMPVRENGNRLLCTLLLSNVAANVVFSITADKIVGTGALAITMATLLIVVFGELLPQALCTNYGLLIGAKTVPLTQFLLFITAPVSYPVSLILDKIFGEEIGQVYNREKLKALILAQKSYGYVGDDEVNIITGALSMNTKTAVDVMTPIDDVYMLPHNAVLDFQTTNDIITHGFTRVPIYEGSRSNICTVLNVKDLAFVDPNDRIPVATVCKFYNRKFVEVDGGKPLCEILRIFKQGSSHLAVITASQMSDDSSEQKARTIGVVTLEDIIEEILQEEIIDETDIFTDNVKREKRRQSNIHSNLYHTINRKCSSRIPPQLRLAALRHATTIGMIFEISQYSSMKETTHKVGCRRVFSNLLGDHSSYIVPYGTDKYEYLLPGALNTESFVNCLRYEINAKTIAKLWNDCCKECRPQNTKQNKLYVAGEATVCATLVLQGHLFVEFSKEGLQFEAGAFTFFGETIFNRM
ncbi:metal transporter CNNM2 [Clonorchis sinensis]|uniref:Metal transporter CNNM2 n=1 Tax=Clonorchis sinensis TaxID=79923 RepID=G7Y8R1_CLOSI|nr:metal transporter CNNM2 [Clonorchis sinensis]